MMAQINIQYFFSWTPRRALTGMRFLSTGGEPPTIHVHWSLKIQEMSFQTLNSKIFWGSMPQTPLAVYCTFTTTTFRPQLKTSSYVSGHLYLYLVGRDNLIHHLSQVSPAQFM